MTANLHMANIVILANTHNPSILSEEWLDGNNVIPKGELVLRTPQVSIIKSKLIEMMADLNRVQLTLLDYKPENFSACSTSARNYLRSLPHIPYAALGFNFHYSMEGHAEPEAINVSFKGAGLSEVTERHILQQGFIAIWEEKSARCRLTFDPLGPKGGEIIFNFHFEPISKIFGPDDDHLDYFLEFHDLSAHLTKAFSAEGEKK